MARAVGRAGVGAGSPGGWAERKPNSSFSIGMINQTLQPVLCTSRLRNLPTEGLFGFEPTCYFGVYKPDTFWLAGES